MRVVDSIWYDQANAFLNVPIGKHDSFFQATCLKNTVHGFDNSFKWIIINIGTVIMSHSDVTTVSGDQSDILTGTWLVAWTTMSNTTETCKNCASFSCLIVSFSKSSKSSNHYLNDTIRFDILCKGPSSGTLIPATHTSHIPKFVSF